MADTTTITASKIHEGMTLVAPNGERHTVKFTERVRSARLSGVRITFRGGMTSVYPTTFLFTVEG